MFHRVLILAGGGAKGAYAFGALKAFREAEIKFDAVAGTSVGALNAILWATESLDEHEQLWIQLSFDNTYPPALLARFPKWARKLVGFVYCLGNIVCSSLRRIPTPGQRNFDFTLDLIASSVATAPLTAVVAMSIRDLARKGWDFQIFSTGALATVLTIASILSFCRRREGGTQRLLVLAFSSWGVGLVCLYLTIKSRLGSLPHGLLLYWGSLAVALSVLALIKSILRRYGSKTCLSQTRLHETVKGILEHHELKIPTFVTCGYQQRIFDRSDGSYSFSDSNSQLVAGEYELEPNTSNVWLAKYVCINELSPCGASTLCLASAALPYGVVPPIEINETLRQILKLPAAVLRFVDGGVADNVPYFPFIERFPAEELFIVLLEPCTAFNCAQKANLTRDTWTDRQYTIDVAELGIPQPKKRNTCADYKFPWGKPLERREPARWPDRIEYFFPKTPPPVGGWGLMNGTLNFTGKYAAALLEMGYEDTKAKLQRLEAGNGIASKHLTLQRCRASDD